MAPVIAATDLLEHASHATDCDTTDALPLVLPAPRHGHTDRLTFLHALFSLRLRRHRAQPGTLQFSRQPEPPLDVLARKYPDIYMTSL